MTIAELINQGADRLQQHSDSPTLDAEVLLAWIVDLDRLNLLQHVTASASDEVAAVFFQFIAARQRGIPIAYLTGRQAFLDFTLAVTPHTLIPRPFTETLVETVLHYLGNTHHVVADIGTGSGAIALAIAKHAPRARVIATDISVPALRVAAANARRHNLLRRVDLRAGSLLEPLRPDDAVTVVVANLPYLPTADMAEPSIRSEPTLALHGGPDGLTLINELLHQTRAFQTMETIILELLPVQVDTIAYLLRQHAFSVHTITDGQVVRGLMGHKNTPAVGRSVEKFAD